MACHLLCVGVRVFRNGFYLSGGGKATSFLIEALLQIIGIPNAGIDPFVWVYYSRCAAQLFLDTGLRRRER